MPYLPPSLAEAGDERLFVIEGQRKAPAYRAAGFVAVGTLGFWGGLQREGTFTEPFASLDQYNGFDRI